MMDFKSTDLKILWTIFYFLGKNDPSQTVTTVQITPKICQASPQTWLTLFQSSSKSVHFRQSYCRKR